MSKMFPVPLLEPANMNRVGLVYVGIDINMVVRLNCETVQFAPHCDMEHLGTLPRPEVAAGTLRGGRCGCQVQDDRLDFE